MKLISLRFIIDVAINLIIYLDRKTKFLKMLYFYFSRIKFVIFFLKKPLLISNYELRLSMMARVITSKKAFFRAILDHNH